MKDEGIALKIKLQTKEKSFINKSCLKVTKVQSGIGGKKIKCSRTELMDLHKYEFRVEERELKKIKGFRVQLRS